MEPSLCRLLYTRLRPIRWCQDATCPRNPGNFDEIKQHVSSRGSNNVISNAYWSSSQMCSFTCSLFLQLENHHDSMLEFWLFWLFTNTNTNTSHTKHFANSSPLSVPVSIIDCYFYLYHEEKYFLNKHKIIDHIQWLFHGRAYALVWSLHL